MEWLPVVGAAAGGIASGVILVQAIGRGFGYFVRSEIGLSNAKLKADLNGTYVRSKEHALEHIEVDRRLGDVEHDVYDIDGYLRTRVHDVANAAGITLLQREVKALSRAADAGD